MLISPALQRGEPDARVEFESRMDGAFTYRRRLAPPRLTVFAARMLQAHTSTVPVYVR
jgi:hypothetical protein